MFEPVQEVAVVDGDHDLRAESSRRGKSAGAQARFAGADQAVEEPLRPGPQVQGRIRYAADPFAAVHAAVCAGTVTPVGAAITRGGVLGTAVSSACPGAGVGGGVHHGQEGFVLVRGGEDFDVLQSAAGLSQEHALAAAEFFLGRFGPVLVDRISPLPGDPGEEVGVVLGRGAGQGVFHPGGGVLVGVVPDPVQRQRDDRRGPGRHSPGHDGGGEFGPDRRLDVTGDPGSGQHRGREGDPAAGFGDADPQTGAEELGRVPGPVIRRIRFGRGRSRVAS